MTFLSGIFFVFLFVTCLLYFIFPLKARWFVLLLSSVVFYLSWGWQALPVVLVTSLMVYLAARRIDTIYVKQDEDLKREGMTPAEKKERKLRAKKRAKRVHMLVSVLVILVLIYTKAGSKIMNSLGSLLGYDVLNAAGELDTSARPAWMTVIVPLGISYYTFSMVGYLADVYWRKDKAEKNFLKFLTWVLFFPKILQGPIARHKKLGEQINEGHVFDYERVCFGVQLALWGYFKKLVIADRLSIFVNSVFGNVYGESGSLIFVIAAIFGSIQLYCDFSGCMDMAGGFCQILGIDLEKNFNHPFFSKSAAEFWRRWHITLGAWFKDYIYMPLAISPRMMNIAKWFKTHVGPRASKNVMTIIPTMIVWILTGLWHGTGYNYLAWGIYWGLLMILSIVFAPEIKKLTRLLRINTEARSWGVVQMIRTFIIFTFARLITIPGHLQTTWDILKQICKQFDIWILFDGTLFNYGLNGKNFFMAMLGIFVLWCVSMLQERGSVREMIARNNIVVRWLIYYVAFFSVIIFGIWGAGFSNVAFTYMQY